jgi:hypothetical protein
LKTRDLAIVTHAGWHNENNVLDIGGFGSADNFSPVRSGHKPGNGTNDETTHDS